MEILMSSKDVAKSIVDLHCCHIPQLQHLKILNIYFANESPGDLVSRGDYHSGDVGGA